MSDTNSIINLDRMAAQHAQEIIRRMQLKKDNDTRSARDKATAVDNMVTKALGVLQENGVYASGLFLLSKSKSKEEAAAEVVMDQILYMLENIGNEMHFGWGRKPDTGNSEQVLKYLSDNVTVNLEQLLLVKETLEQMLIYARYGAKASGAGGGNT